MKNFSILIGFLLIPFLTFSQSEVMAEMAENQQFLSTNYPQTKVYLHTDKPYYVVGEDIWYAAYAVNSADYSLNPVSQIVHVVLESPEGERIAFQSLKLNGKFAHGDFTIAAEWPEGIYTIKGYTSFMKNFDNNFIFSKEIPVWSDAKEMDTDEVKSTSDNAVAVRFFPEGGELIDGLFTKVAFEVSDPTVSEISILDEDGTLVTTGKTIAEGLGYFSILPSRGSKYYAEIDNKKIALPAVERSGYTFNVNAQGGENIYVDVLASEDKDLSGAFVIGHIRGLIFLQQECAAGNKATFKLDKNSLPEGVSHVTLFDQNGKPLAERTFFVEHSEKDMTVAISIPYEYMNKRQKTDVTVSLRDQENTRTNGHYSVTVVDNEKVLGLESLPNIRTYLLLSSDFTESIADVGQFFGESKAKSRFMTDILMLTKGWTRFKWDEVKEKKEPEITHVPENGFTISGQVLERGKPVKANVDLSVIGEDLFTVETETDESGYFRIFSLDLEANSNISLSAAILGKKDKKKTRGIELILDDHLPANVSSKQKLSYKGLTKEDMSEYITTAYQMLRVDSMFSGMSVQLDEVGISASRRAAKDKKIRKDRNIMYTNYDKRVFMDSLTNVILVGNVFDLVRTTVPGVQIVGPSGSQVFRIRGGSNSIMGNNDAVVLIDGVQVDYGLVNNLIAEQVEFIDVLRGLSTSALYGTPNGVIAIYTRQGFTPVKASKSTAKNVANILHEGYYAAREFYSPDYTRGFAGAEKPDLRTTLYWNPAVVTREGESNFSFHTGDNATIYLIEVQGLTEDGIPFVGYERIEVR